MEVVVLVPGFFGFGQFGSPPGKVLEYFAGVKQALVRAEPSLDGRIVVHEPPPTGSIEERVESLHLAVERLLAGSPLPHSLAMKADRVRLVGHSAGGVDARLFAHPGYFWARGPTGDARERTRRAVQHVVTLSAPHRGTPVATGELGDYHALVILVTALSMLGMAHVSVLAPLAAVVTAVGHVAPDVIRSLAVDPVLGLATGLDANAAREIQRYIDELANDHRLMDDLAVAAMEQVTARLSGADHPRIDCYVSASPTPRFGLSHPLGRWLYGRLHAATASGVAPGPSPSGPIIGNAAPPFALDERASDGVVPVTSQTVNGTAAGIVYADHEDVIGHFDGGPGTTVFKSDSDFDVPRFEALWANIARRLVS